MPCVPIDCSSSFFLLEASDLPNFTPNILSLVPPQLPLQFLPVGILTLSESVFEFPFYLFEFCPVPYPESPLIPVEKGLQVSGYPGFVVWVSVDFLPGMVLSMQNLMYSETHSTMPSIYHTEHSSWQSLVLHSVHPWSQETTSLLLSL